MASMIQASNVSGRPRLLTAALVVLCSVAAMGQDKSTYFTVRHPEKFTTDWRAFYDRAEEMTAEVRRTWPHHLDLPYGSDPKQRLDLYLPAGRVERAPVFIFIHGGGFVEGDRAQYGFVAGPLARAGIITAVASYRLLPRVYPDQLIDTRQMVAWAYANIRRYGGDRNAIFVGGHSAGAILSAHVGVTTDWQAALGLPPDVVKGCVPVSGPYDLRKASGFVADFLPDPATREPASPALQLHRAPPMVVAYGSEEPPYAEGSRAFVKALQERGANAVLLPLEGMGHDATALAAGDPDSALARATVSLVTAAAATTSGGASRAAGNEVDGLWQYRSIARAGGTAVPLDGVFLLRDGRFVQHSVNRGAPGTAQLAQGHVGTFSWNPGTGALALEATVGFLVDPALAAGSWFVPREGRHESVARPGESLTLTFSTGTVQGLTRLGPGEGDIIDLQGGALALVDGFFILVHAEGTRALTAAGTATRRDGVIDLRAARWVSTTERGAPDTYVYSSDRTLSVRLNGNSLEVPAYGPVAIETRPRR